jgi:hypothetical protein
MTRGSGVLKGLSSVYEAKWHKKILEKAKRHDNCHFLKKKKYLQAL